MNLREWALPVYTVLIQMATGTLAVLWIIRTLGLSRFGRAEMDSFTRNPVIIILLTIIVAMIGSHFHLSRPYLSILALSNFKTSWLSREIVFTVFFSFSVGLLWALQAFTHLQGVIKDVLGWLGVLFGGITIYAMSGVYQLPTQVVWNTPITTYSFYATSILLGVFATAAILVFDLKLAEIQAPEKLELRGEIVRNTLRWLAGLAVPMVLVALFLDYRLIVVLQSQAEAAHLSLDLMLNLYKPLLIFRLITLLVGVVWLAWTVFSKQIHNQRLIGPVYMSCLMVFVGEILGRFLFYATHIRLGL
jgi:anaerobic dimethyl sulfoxide reductase subunit C (anchor subunit)